MKRVSRMKMIATAFASISQKWKCMRKQVRFFGPEEVTCVKMSIYYWITRDWKQELVSPLTVSATNAAKGR